MCGYGLHSSHSAYLVECLWHPLVVPLVRISVAPGVTIVAAACGHTRAHTRPHGGASPESLARPKQEAPGGIDVIPTYWFPRSSALSSSRSFQVQHDVMRTLLDLLVVQLQMGDPRINMWRLQAGGRAHLHDRCRPVGTSAASSQGQPGEPILGQPCAVYNSRIPHRRRRHNWTRSIGVPGPTDGGAAKLAGKHNAISSSTYP